MIFNKYSNQLKFQIVEKPFTTIPEPQTDMAKKCKCLEQFGNLGQTMVRNIWVFSPLVPSKQEKTILVLLS